MKLEELILDPQGGDLLTVSLKNAGGCEEVFIFLEHSGVLEISDNQIAFYD